MEEGQHKIDHDAIDFAVEEASDRYLTEEEYLIQAFNSVSATIIPDSFYERNWELIRNATNDLHDRHSRQGDMSPKLAGRVLEIMFSSIGKFGLR